MAVHVELLLALAIGACGAPSSDETAKASAQDTEAPAPECPRILDGIEPGSEHGLPTAQEALGEATKLLEQRGEGARLTTEEAAELAKKLADGQKPELVEVLTLELTLDRTDLPVDTLAEFRIEMDNVYRDLQKLYGLCLVALSHHDAPEVTRYVRELEYMETLVRYRRGTAAPDSIEKFGGEQCMKVPVAKKTLREFESRPATKRGM